MPRFPTSKEFSCESDAETGHFTAFEGSAAADFRLAQSPRSRWPSSGPPIRRPSASILIFDDLTGRAIDLDLRGSDRRHPRADLARSKNSEPVPADPPVSEPRGRGRPKLGVVAREVTLLPRHWEWLGAQPGGASVALRKLVEQARRVGGDKDRSRAARDAAYHFMSAIAGNLPGFEEAARALFADDRRRFVALIAAWPADIRDHAVRLARSATAPTPHRL